MHKKTIGLSEHNLMWCYQENVKQGNPKVKQKHNPEGKWLMREDQKAKDRYKESLNTCR